MTNKDKLKESAAAGAVGAHSVAVRFDSDDKKRPMKKRGGSFLDFMQKHNSKVVNRLNMKPIKTPFNISLKENVSLDQIYSKLSGIQNQSRMQDDNTQTYGVEDDEGNLMKITVRGDQQEEFETALARELAEVEEYKMTGRGGGGRNVSMAEVLYNLKQNFDVVNVEFPEIPKDKVYNADKVSDPDDLETDLPDPEANVGNAEQGDDEFGGDEELGDVDFGEEGGEGDAPVGDEEDSEFGGEEEEEDLGTEFGAEDESEESMLKTIVKMLSAEAEARKAQYDAEAEKSRALQAKYSMKAAQEEMENQEELAQMEKEMEQQKEKEKEAKKLADLARFKMRGDVKESFSSLGEFMTHILEMEEELGDEEADPNDPMERRLRQQTATAKKRLEQHRARKAREQEMKARAQRDETHPNQDPKRVAAP